VTVSDGGQRSAVPAGFDWDAGLPSDETLQESAYLVSRGVRAMALAGTCQPGQENTLRAITRLRTAAQYLGDSVIPFVIQSASYAVADCGYASHPWVIGLYQWARSEACARAWGHEITGLLLGYSPAAIARHGELDAGEPRQRSSSPPPGWSGPFRLDGTPDREPAGG